MTRDLKLANETGPARIALDCPKCAEPAVALSCDNEDGDEAQVIWCSGGHVIVRTCKRAKIVEVFDFDSNLAESLREDAI